LQLLQAILAQFGEDVSSHDLIVSLKRAGADLLSPLSRRAQFEPVLSPYCERYAVGINMLAGMNGILEGGKPLLGFLEGAVKGYSMSLFADAVTQTESVFATLINATVTV
jgi:hypothetical protein